MIIVVLLLPYVIYGIFNGSLNVCRGKNYSIRRLVWSLVWFPVFILDHTIMGHRSMYANGDWRWL